MLCKLALGNVRKSLRDFSIYFLTLALGISVFYAFNSIDAQTTILSLDTDKKQALDVLSTLVGYVSVAIAVVLGFLVVYANRFLIRRRKREFGLYLTLGMGRLSVAAVLVLEALLVGVLSLVAGILLGLAESQLMLYLTATLFDVVIDRFQFAFSQEACLLTTELFALVFLVALVLDVGLVGRTKLIDLINADRANEVPRLRNFWLSLSLLVVALGMIGYAYWLLRQVGLYSIATDPQGFATCTAVVFAGTFLLFFALSGVAQRFAQSSGKLYWRGLNMFVFRQLNAKISTAWASIALVSIVLFFAITSTCGGFAICSTMNADLEKTTAYDVTLEVSMWGALPGNEPDKQERAQQEKMRAQAEKDGNSIEAALVRAVPAYGKLVEASAQVDFRASEKLMFADVFAGLDAAASGLSPAVLEGMNHVDSPVWIVAESQYNDVCKLSGDEPVQLEPGQFAFWCDMPSLQGAYRAYLREDPVLDVDGRQLAAAGDGLVTAAYETSYNLNGMGAVILDDDDPLLEEADVFQSMLNVMLAGGRDAADKFVKAIESDAASKTWVWTNGIGYCTAKSVYAESVSTSTIVTYLAIYIGFVFLVACAAILALQQLSEASDNVRRYRLLRDLGAEQRMVNGALFAQVLVYFAAPLAVAACHSYVAFGEVAKVVELIGSMQVVQPLAATCAFALVVYGGYFLVTYLVSRSIITQRR